MVVMIARALILSGLSLLLIVPANANTDPPLPKPKVERLDDGGYSVGYKHDILDADWLADSEEVEWIYRRGQKVVHRETREVQAGMSADLLKPGRYTITRTRIIRYPTVEELGSFASVPGWRCDGTVSEEYPVVSRDWGVMFRMTVQITCTDGTTNYAGTARYETNAGPPEWENDATWPPSDTSLALTTADTIRQSQSQSIYLKKNEPKPPPKTTTQSTKAVKRRALKSLRALSPAMRAQTCSRYLADSSTGLPADVIYGVAKVATGSSGPFSAKAIVGVLQALNNTCS